MNRDLLVRAEVTLLQAMDALTKGNQKIVFVVDEGDRLLGTLTDGDIRRFILAGHDLAGSIDGAFNRGPVFVRRGEYTPHALRAVFQERLVDVIPVVDDAGRVVECVTWHEAFEEPQVDAGEIAGVPVVIMAGGMGTRMQPFTHVLPKPLLPIDGKPVIDHIIDRFRAAGAGPFYLMVNHKARILRAYLEDAHPGGDLRLVQEEQPLGTAGALRLLDGMFTAPVMVTNCDVLLAINYRELLDFHTTNGCDMTLVASLRNFRLPYGACRLGPDGMLLEIEEKPELTRLVNTGLYVVNPEVFATIPADRAYNMNTLMSDLTGRGGRVGVFPVSTEAWLDVGQWEEYRRTAQVLGHGSIEPELP